MFKQSAHMLIASPSRTLIDYLVDQFSQFAIGHVLIVADEGNAQQAWISQILLGSSDVSYQLLGDDADGPTADIHIACEGSAPSYVRDNQFVYDVVIFDCDEVEHEYTPADAYSPTGRAMLSRSNKIKPRVYEGMDAFGPLNDALPPEWG